MGKIVSGVVPSEVVMFRKPNKKEAVYLLLVLASAVRDALEGEVVIAEDRERLKKGERLGPGYARRLVK